MKQMKFKEKTFLQFARRFFIRNGFDGGITVLGVILGSFISGVADPTTILLVGVNTCIAMLIAGTWGAILSESAEKKRRTIELEKAMLKDLDPTAIGKRRKKETYLLSAINGLAPFIIGMISLIPFFLALTNIITMQNSYFASFGLTAITLIGLGAFLGKISKTSKLKYGFLMLLAGVTAALANLIIVFFK